MKTPPNSPILDRRVSSLRLCFFMFRRKRLQIEIPVEEDMEGTSSSNHHYVDDFYFSALYDEEQIFPISDEKYARELQLQEALISSAFCFSMQDRSLDHIVNNHPTPKKEDKSTKNESAESSQSFCMICMDVKPPESMFRNNNCTHSFCTDCIAKYIAAKIQENITMLKCPNLNCKANLEPEFCRAFVPQQVFDRWENALCESLVLGSQRFYCPFKDCSAMLMDDGEESVSVSECPSCHRLFCAQCKVPWHAGIECREFQGLNKDEREREDIMVMELAKNKKWRRCPKCNFYVEKVDGCLHIVCRCGYPFCYRCGSQWTQIHACLPI